MPPSPRRHVVLVGLPGSGKSTVGRLVADILHVRLLDIDVLVTRRAGQPIAAIFDQRGEAAFRDLERQETERSLKSEPAVIVPGGGWAAQPGNLVSVRGRAITVYLRTSPPEAARRAARGGGRPLLDTDDPAATMEALMSERIAFYERCDVQVDTEGKTPQEVAAEVAELAQQWAPG